MTQDTQNDLPTQPNPLEVGSASNTKAASGHQSNVHTNSDSNGGSGSNGQTPAGSDGPTATPSGSPNGNNTHSNVNSTGDGVGSAYQRPCYGGSKGNGSSFDMDKEEYDKLMSKEKKYAKIGQKILDLADVKVNGTRPFDFNVHHPQLLQRVIQKGSLGLGEAFMEGWWDTTDFYSLHVFFEKILRGGIEYYFPNNAMDMANVLKARIINPQTKKKSKKVGLMHYDMGNEFFERMLGTYMQYSCGYWVQHKHESELTDEDREKIRRQQEKNATYNSDTDGFVYDGFHDESTYLLNGTTDKENGAQGHMHAVPITDLEEAQFTKLKMIGDKLRLKPGMEVLDVGCGWGGLALFLAEHYHVKVVGITISEEQKKNAERMTAAYRDDITILNTDYRDIQAYYEKEKNEKNKKFDRIVSVGMFEHVGPKNYKKYFEVMRSLLNDEDPDAVFVLHTIGAKQTMESADQWYLRYIFPGGCLPSMTNIGKNIENTFVMEDMHNFGYFYYLTLLAWRDRFLAYWVENHSMPNNVKRKQLETSRTAKKKSKEEKQAKKALKKKKSNSASSATPTPSGDPNAEGNHEQGFSPSSARNVTTADDEAVPAQATSTNEDHQATASTTAQASPETEQEKHDRETFFRMFYYYLSSSAGAFKARDLQLWQFVLSPNGVRGYPDVARA